MVVSTHPKSPPHHQMCDTLIIRLSYQGQGHIHRHSADHRYDQRECSHCRKAMELKMGYLNSSNCRLSGEF
jgi:hypothetical protein